ncbi:MAG: hypothetical protein ACTSWN_09150 [Promethearchaeota archaeon]
MRCPYCGNRVQKNQYTCVVCGRQLIVEKIENLIPYFKRHEEKWRKPFNMFERFKLILINPGKAFWDISHKPSLSAGWFMFFMNSLLFGLVGIILAAKIDTRNLEFAGTYYNTLFYYSQAFNYLEMYIMFFIIGMINYAFLWSFYSLLQTIMAKIIMNITPKWREQNEIFCWAYFPSLFATAGYLIVLAIGLPELILPAADISPGYWTSIGWYYNNYYYSEANQLDLELMSTAIAYYFQDNKNVFMVADMIQIVVYFGYISLLFSIAIREYYGTSTLKALINCLIVGLVCAGIYIYTRSSFPIGIL